VIEINRVVKMRRPAERGLLRFPANSWCVKFFVFLIPYLLFPACLLAQTWNGGGTDDNWSTGGNWVGGVSPANPIPAAGTANVVFDGSVRLTPNIDTAWNINSLTFNSGASAFTIGGNLLFLEAGITDNSTNTQTINAPLKLGVASSAVTFTTASGGNLVIAGNMDWYGVALTVTGAGNTTFSGTGTDTGPGASLVKTGAGTLTMTGPNGYIGTTSINAGVVNIQNATALGTTAAGTTVASGAALEIQGGIAVGAETLTLNSTGISSNGALRNISGNNSWAGAVTLGSASSIGVDAGQLTISSRISGAGMNLTKVGAGTLVFSGTTSNTYTGTTTVNDGTLILGKTAGVNAFAGTLTIGDAVGAANSAIVQLNANNQIPTVTVTIKDDGQLNLNNFSDTIGALTMTGGNVTTGTGTLTLGGNVTGNAASTVATISGKLALGGANRTFTIASGTTGSTDMDISAVISGIRSITKAGSGTLTLSGTSANTFTGATTINAGTLELSKTGALGSTSSVSTVAETRPPMKAGWRS
jgi:autotransporter-associated beta strand protein